MNAQLAVPHGQSKSLMGIEVHFRFDKAQLDPSYMSNAQSLRRFAHVVDSIGIQKIDSVVIVSQSSPEGAYLHNMKLSQRRANTMRQTVEQRHPNLVGKLHVHPDGESWDRLREYVVKDTLMKQSTINKVLSIIDAKVGIDTKKWRMEQLPVYNYLRRTYYPRIRNSVFCIIYYEELPPVVEVKEDSVDTLDIIVPPVEVDTICDTIPAPEVLPEPRVPFMNVHSNLLYDVLLTPSVGVEFYIGKNYSVAANYTFSWWSKDVRHRYMQLIDAELEGRRYFKKDRTHARHYLAVYAHGNLYDYSFDRQRAWQGEGWGVGLGYGYVWRPWKNKRWKIDAFVRLGYYQSLYDPYHASNPYNDKYYYDWNGPIDDFVRRNHRLRWLGPTGIGINISYDLMKRSRKP